MSKEKNPLPKTAEDLDNQLEERFCDELQKSSSFARPVIERFEDEYFNEAERENMPAHMFALAREVTSEFPTDSRPQCNEDASGGFAVPSPPIANRGVTLYTCPVPDSMQLVTHPDVSPTPQRIMGGYDGGVEVGFNGQWRAQTFEHLQPLLEDSRKQAQAKHGDPAIELDGLKFQMQPRGGGKRTHYRYILAAGGTQVLIHQNPEGDLQPVRIRYGAEALIGRNLFAVHESVRGWLDALGFEVEKETVSRVDLQVMVERPVGEFFKLINSGCVVKKAGKWGAFGDYGDAETFQLGKNIEICIYDKVREMLNIMMVKEPIKFSRMIECCFDGDENLSQPVTRVEFRLRRAALKSHRINTMQDLQEIEPALVAWLTENWFRLLSVPKKRGRENKQEVAPVWREVQERFREYFPGVDGVRREIIPRSKGALKCSAEHLLNQAYGCIASALAITGFKGDAKQIGDASADLVRKDQERIYERFVKRSAKLSIAADALQRAE